MTWIPRMYRLTGDELCTEDLDRAAELLDIDPDDILSSGPGVTNRQRITLIIWCLKSRHVPGFTWEQARKVPLGEFRSPDDDAPPPIPEPDANGSSPSKRASRPSGTAPSGSAPASSAAPTSA
jgi:hypothetical protein